MDRWPRLPEEKHRVEAGGRRRVVPEQWEGDTSSPDFGKIMQLVTGTAPRIIQLAVKYLF